MKDKVVLAYSGGLDTPPNVLARLKENSDYDEMWRGKSWREEEGER